MTRQLLKANDGKISQQVFVETYCANGGNATRAAIVAGYSERSAPELGRRLLTNPKIIEGIRLFNMKHLQSGLAVKALSVLEQIMVDDSAPAGARVDCAKTILDRAGYKIGGLGDGLQKNVNEMSHDELMSIINNYPKVIKELSESAEVVDGEVIP